MKIRIKFRKWGIMKFVGHLDIMRYFQKAVRRAHIDIRYTEGFSPHPVMSFAAPLGVGATGDGEYMDIEVNSCPSSADLTAALNAVMVDGVSIVSSVLLPDHSPSAMAAVAAADYTVSFRNDGGNPYEAGRWQELIEQEFYSCSRFTIIKKTKKSERELDLKPLVYRFFAEEDAPGKTAFHLTVSTGSTDNIKPEAVLEALFARCSVPFDPMNLQIHRKEVYTRDEGGRFIPLEAMGVPFAEAILTEGGKHPCAL